MDIQVARQHLTALLSSRTPESGDHRAIIASLSESEFLALVRPSLHFDGTEQPLGRGTPVAPGAMAGRAWNSLPQLLTRPAEEPTVLICDRLHSEHLSVLNRIGGVLARAEDPSSHAAIVARVNGVPILSGIDAQVEDGQWVSIDSNSKQAWLGRARVQEPDFGAPLGDLLDLLSEVTGLVVHANADTAREALLGGHQWAAGFEPRTEHMVLQESALRSLQMALLAPESSTRRFLGDFHSALRLEMEALYRVAGSRPVLVRLLDPPIHEFIPREATHRRWLASSLNMTEAELSRRIAEVSEVNPMTGLRGARLLLVRPELARVQVEAILHAALDAQVGGCPLESVSITIPMVVDANEVRQLRHVIDDAVRSVTRLRRQPPEIRLGAMVETPRAALLAEEIAGVVDYMSFGTNDLSAQVFAFSRGDVYGRFLANYLDNGIIREDPFHTLDRSVAELMEICVKRARAVQPSLQIGICGEHASQPHVISFCLRKDLRIDSVSVAPHLIPETLFYAAKATVVQPS